MRTCHECCLPLVVHIETRRWETVILSGVSVYRCANGHDQLVIPKLGPLSLLIKTTEHRTFSYHETEGCWEKYGGCGALGADLYVLEERELPDGEWTCDDLLGFDTEEEAVKVVYKEADSLKAMGGVRDYPEVEVRIVRYQRALVVRVIPPGGTPPN